MATSDILSATKTFFMQNPQIYKATHPQYRVRVEQWEKIRDVLAGEDRVKEQRHLYLPDVCAFTDRSEQKYTEYLMRTVFVPYAQHVAKVFTGVVFRRPVNVTGNFTYDLDDVANENIQLFFRKVGDEIFKMGRVGVFTDYKKGLERAVSTIYPTEQILSWDVDINGNLNYVLLQDEEDIVVRLADINLTDVRMTTPNFDVRSMVDEKRYAYKTLELKNGKYVVTTYDELFKQKTVDIPLVRGKPMDYIPFKIFNPENEGTDVEDSPILKIVNLNLAHYRTSALLETGRHYASFPVYVVPVDQNTDDTSYTISPSVVWEVPMDSKPFVLEFYGQGLNHLAQALTEKESQLVQMGARLTGIRSLDTKYEAPDIFSLLYQSELSVLISITESLQTGLQQVIETNFDMSNVAGTKDSWDINVVVSNEFRTTTLMARELRAVSQLYEEGQIPLSELFRILQASDFISSELTFEEFEIMIKKEKAERVKEAEVQMRKELEIEKEKACATNKCEVEGELKIKKEEFKHDDKVRKEEQKEAEKDRKANKDNPAFGNNQNVAQNMLKQTKVTAQDKLKQQKKIPASQ